MLIFSTKGRQKSKYSLACRHDKSARTWTQYDSVFWWLVWSPFIALKDIIPYTIVNYCDGVRHSHHIVCTTSIPHGLYRGYYRGRGMRCGIRTEYTVPRPGRWHADTAVWRAHNSRLAELQITAASNTNNNSTIVGCNGPLAMAAEEGFSVGDSSSDSNRPPLPVGPSLTTVTRPLVLTGGRRSLPPATVVQLNQNSPIDRGSSCSTRIRRSLNFQKPRFLKKYVAPVYNNNNTCAYAINNEHHRSCSLPAGMVFSYFKLGSN